MNKLFFVVALSFGCLAVAIRADLIAYGKLRECAQKMEAQIAKIRVPDDLEKISRLALERAPAGAALTDVVRGEFDVAEYVEKLSDAQKKTIRGQALEFNDQKIDLLHEIDCDDEDFFEVISLKSAEYDKLIKSNYKAIDDFNGYAELSRKLLDSTR